MSMRFEFERLPLDGLVLIKPKAFFDGRGYFMESYRESDFFAAGINNRFVQDNHSFSVKNVLRGLHFQLNPRAQGKLVRVVQGAVWDVAVDLRRQSPTFAKWEGYELTGENRHMLYIPPGFAHGFLVTSNSALFAYKCTRSYDPTAEGGVLWNDPDVGIEWPNLAPVLYKRDRCFPRLADIPQYRLPSYGEEG